MLCRSLTEMATFTLSMINAITTNDDNDDKKCHKANIEEQLQ